MTLPSITNGVVSSVCLNASTGYNCTSITCNTGYSLRPATYFNCSLGFWEGSPVCFRKPSAPSLSHPRTFALSPAHLRSLSRAPSLSLPRTFTLSPAHLRSLSRAPSLSHPRTFALSPAHLRSLTRAPSLSLTRTPALSHPRSPGLHHCAHQP
jgi:hypothetical protein